MTYASQIALTYERIGNRYMLACLCGDDGEIYAAVLQILARAHSAARKNNYGLADIFCHEALQAIVSRKAAA